MKASVFITTRNRKEELAKAVASAMNQTARPEVIVIDDGSTDGTEATVKEKFPQVDLHRFEVSQGLIVQRNRGIFLAKCPIVFSIDDDAVFSSPTVIADVLKEFDHPRVGAVAIPFVDVNRDSKTVKQCAPDGSQRYVCPSFIGTAHALRKDLFLRLGGYRESLFHQGEESDYCLRILAAGYVVRLGRSDVIQHFESPRRDFRRMDVYGRRNNVLFGWHNVPGSVLPLYLAATTWNGLRHGVRVGRTSAMVNGLLRGFGAIGGEWNQRSPVPASVFKLYRDLVKRNCIPLSEVERRLPPALTVETA